MEWILGVRGAFGLQQRRSESGEATPSSGIPLTTGSNDTEADEDEDNPSGSDEDDDTPAEDDEDEDIKFDTRGVREKRLTACRLPTTP